MLSADDGARAVRLARSSLLAGLDPSPASRPRPAPDDDLPAVFDEPRGVFVTLRRYPSARLRGCIGYPLPVYPLRTALVRAALSAATDDPRFPPVRRAELDALTVEVSVLTVPIAITATRPEDRLVAVRVGRDGLIVEGHGTSGLLLPQVGPEQGWTSEELLEGTCEKAGLPSGAWRDPQVTIRRFEAEVFTERAPGGDVRRDDA
jgi:uncharacterized protein